VYREALQEALKKISRILSWLLFYQINYFYQKLSLLKMSEMKCATFNKSIVIYPHAALVPVGVIS
jgi:hypothetical protein